MKVVVMGAGALGGYFGGRLAAAGHEVTLIARGAHLAALRKNGLKIRSPKGDLHLEQIGATDDPSGLGPVDVVLFMVKNYDVEASAHAIKPLIGRDTMVVTCQNGVSAPDRLATVIGSGHVIPGVARLPADVAEPGVIRHSADFDRFDFGEYDGGISDRCRAFHDALEKAGTMPVLSPDIRVELWGKMIMQATLASITALTRLDIGPLRDNPDTAAMLYDSMEETARVGDAVVGGLPAGTLETAWDFLKTRVPANVHASMLDDLNRGKRLEIDYLSGDVVRLGRKHGVATPIHHVFWAALQPFKDGAPG